MTGNGPSNDPPTSGTDWSGTGFRPSTEPIGGEEERTTDTPSTSISTDRPDVDALETRLDRRDADLQYVIDRYEAVIESQRTDEDRRTMRSRPRRFVRSVRARFDALVTDVEIALRSRRD